MHKKKEDFGAKIKQKKCENLIFDFLARKFKLFFDLKNDFFRIFRFGAKIQTFL